MNVATLRGTPMSASWAWLEQRRTRIWSFADQGFQGAANVFASAILARALPRAEFAIVGLMIGIHYFVFGLHRAGLVLAYILDSAEHGEGTPATTPSGRPRHSAGLTGNRWWWLNLASIAALAVLLVAVAAGLEALLGAHAEWQWMVRAIKLSALATPALLFFEFGRRVLYQQHRSGAAATGAAVYAMASCGLALVIGRWAPSAEAGAMCWALGGLAAGVVVTLAAPPSAPALRDGWARMVANAGFACWQMLSHVAYALYAPSAVILVGLFGGAGVAAAFTAARTLTNPAISIVNAVDSLDKPRAARWLAKEGTAGLRRSVSQTRRTLALTCGAWLGAIALFAGIAMHVVFGNRYDGELTEIRVLCLAFFLTSLNLPSETALIVLRASRVLFAVRVLACVCAAMGMWLGRTWGFMGICVALTAVQMLNLVTLNLAERWAERAWLAKGASTPPVESVA